MPKIQPQKEPLSLDDVLSLREASEFTGISYATLKDHTYLRKLLVPHKIANGAKSVFTKSQMRLYKQLYRLGLKGIKANGPVEVPPNEAEQIFDTNRLAERLGQNPAHIRHKHHHEADEIPARKIAGVNVWVLKDIDMWERTVYGDESWEAVSGTAEQMPTP